MFLRAYGAVFSVEETFRIPRGLAIGEGRVKKATLPIPVGKIALQKRLAVARERATCPALLGNRGKYYSIQRMPAMSQ